RFNKEVRTVKEDIYILGEIWHSSQNWLNGDEFHAVMNYTFTDLINDFFIKRMITPLDFVTGLNEQLLLYRQQTNEVMFNMLDSHDTARILTMAKGDKDLVKSALAFMFLQHGSPCIYYGTEVGMEGDNDPDCRKCMVWEPEQQDRDMLEFTKQLISLRKRYQPLLSYGKLDWHAVRDGDMVVGYQRKLGDQEVVVHVNQ